MLDYAANGSAFWTPGQLRTGLRTMTRRRAERLVGWLDPSEDEPETVADDFWQAVGTNLKEGRIRLIFVADEIPASLQRLVEFLNEQMPRVEVLALEIRQYRAAGSVPARWFLVWSARPHVPRPSRNQPRPQPAALRDGPPMRCWRRSRRQGKTRLRLLAPSTTGPQHTHTSEPPAALALSHPSLTMSADTGRSTSRFRGVLSLYASPHGGQPMLEIRVKRMCRTPRYNRNETRACLVADLHARGVPRLETEDALIDKRPTFP